MKVRHAAALALVGWYLMVPRIASDKSRVLYEEPIRDWTVVRSFDSAVACETERTDFKSKTANSKDDLTKSAGLAIQCVATDDPRLAK